MNKYKPGMILKHKYSDELYLVCKYEECHLESIRLIQLKKEYWVGPVEHDTAWLDAEFEIVGTFTDHFIKRTDISKALYD